MADMVVGMEVDMEVDMVADMEGYKETDKVADIGCDPLYHILDPDHHLDMKLVAILHISCLRCRQPLSPPPATILHHRHQRTRL